MRWLVGFMLIICLMIGVAASGFGDLVVEKSDSPGLYDVTWSNCAFTQALKDLHSQFDIQSFAQILDSERTSSTDGTKEQLLNLVAVTMGYSFGRDYTSIGTTPVFRPVQLPGLSSARDMVAGQLIASFNPRQLQIHRSKGLLPFGELIDQQQEQVSYLVRTFTHHTQYPEPELSQRLQKSAVIMTIVPVMDFKFEHVDEQGRTVKMGSGFYCDRNFSEDFWKAKASGQLEAYHLNTASMTNPGPDVPGDSAVHSLDGTYTLAELLRKVKDSSSSIKVEGDENKIRFEAHCDMTSASIARACGIATGMDWHREKDGWYLAADSVPQAISAFGTTVDSSVYIREYERQLPAIQKIAYQGNMILAADKVWQTNTTLQEMLQGASVRWDALTPDQQAYLKIGAEMYNRTGSPFPGLVAGLPNLKLSWLPNIKLYIVNGDAALYTEWLRFEPMFPPEGEKDFLNPKPDAADPKSK